MRKNQNLKKLSQNSRGKRIKIKQTTQGPCKRKWYTRPFNLGSRGLLKIVPQLRSWQSPKLLAFVITLLQAIDDIFFAIIHVKCKVRVEFMQGSCYIKLTATGTCSFTRYRLCTLTFYAFFEIYIRCETSFLCTHFTSTLNP